MVVPVRLSEQAQQVILHGCRCCPDQRRTWCQNYNCAAPAESRVCEAEQLRGCSCWIREDAAREFERHPVYAYDGSMIINYGDRMQQSPGEAQQALWSFIRQHPEYFERAPNGSISGLRAPAGADAEPPNRAGRGYLRLWRRLLL